jgi:hypothetical protein
MQLHDLDTAPRLRASACLLLAAACLAVAGCGGGKSSGDSPTTPPSGAPSAPSSGSAGSADPPASSASAPSGIASAPSGTSTAQSFTPLSYPQQDPTTQYTLSDGTLVTQIGGRVRDRHAREQPDSPGTGDPYDLFAAHYSSVGHTRSRSTTTSRRRTRRTTC